MHWRRKEHARAASRGAIIAILNPRLVEVATKIGTKENLLLVENPKQVEKLGECPALGPCKKKGCKLPCNTLRRESYCRHHLDLMYASKNVRVAMGGADAKAARLLGQKRPGPKLSAKAKVAKPSEPEDAEGAAKAEAAKAERAKEEQQKRMELALHLDDRRFLTAEANESYVKYIVGGMKPEEASMSRVPQLGRGFDTSGCLEVMIPAHSCSS